MSINLLSVDNTELKLFYSVDEANKFLKAYGKAPIEGNPSGCVWSKLVDNEFLVVYINPERRGLRLQATVAHEAVHAAVALFKEIGEDDPGEETMAYAVGNLYKLIAEAMEDTGEYHF